MLVYILEKLVFLNFFGSYICLSYQQVLKDYLNNINPDSALPCLHFESQTGKPMPTEINHVKFGISICHERFRYPESVFHLDWQNIFMLQIGTLRCSLAEMILRFSMEHTAWTITDICMDC